MLPFLDEKKIETVISASGKKPEAVEYDAKAACNACAERLISGVNSNDPSKIVSAIKDMMILLDSESDSAEVAMGE